ncbi:MAG: hypothetical protein AVDCRST_MAG88-2413, partial [uncultured Thermomicrobiales bacterium]
TDFEPPMPTFDTTDTPPTDVAKKIGQWVRESTTTPKRG